MLQLFKAVQNLLASGPGECISLFVTAKECATDMWRISREDKSGCLLLFVAAVWLHVGSLGSIFKSENAVRGEEGVANIIGGQIPVRGMRHKSRGRRNGETL